MRKFVFAFVLCGFVGSLAATAQVPSRVTGTLLTGGGPAITSQDSKPVAAPTDPVLTAEQEAVLEAKVMKVEQASRDLSPEGIGKAITDYINARQQALQALNGDLSTYVQGLQKADYDITRDPKTGKFLYVKKTK